METPDNQPRAASVLRETEHRTNEESKIPPKTLSFYLAFLALRIIVLIVSIDATALSVAVPVSSSSRRIFEGSNSGKTAYSSRPTRNDTRVVLGESILPPRRCHYAATLQTLG